jgi:capsular exopolysaccharide synthesis family protein
MGKFSDALKKSGAVKPKPTSRTAKPSTRPDRKTVEAQRLKTTVQRLPVSAPAFSRNGMDPRLASALEPGCPAAESFKMLRARIFTESTGFRRRTIMVTSPQALDGKTMVAVNLSISIAQGINERVVIVDCDFRNPSVGRYLGVNTDKGGIREYLENGTSIAPYLVKTPIDKLTALPVGKPPSNPSELLSSEKMRRLVNELKNRYEDRYIIFDSPPAQFAAETTFLATMVDGMVLVVRSGKTTKNSIQRAVANIGPNKSKIIGIAFNASNESPKDYDYYYRYYQKRKP